MHNLMYSKQLGRMAAMFADNKAWHGLGVVAKGAQTWQDTIKLAGLDWTVGKYPLFDQKGQKVAAWGIFKEAAPGQPESFIASVGDRYTPIQNEYAFQFVDALMEAENGSHYDSAGALGNGEKIWCLARVPFDFSVNGNDQHQTYLLFTTSHDGSLAAQCKLTTVRVVCQNTLNQALRMNGTFTRVKHTKEAEAKLEAAKALMTNARTSVQELKTKLDTLAHKILDKKTYVDILDQLFPKPKDEKVSTTKRDNTLLEITKLFDSNDGNAFPDERGTAINLYNAVTAYTDHFRSTRRHESDSLFREYNSDMARTESALFGGSGEALKINALDITLEASKNLPEKVPAKTFTVTVQVETTPLKTFDDDPPVEPGLVKVFGVCPGCKRDFRWEVKPDAIPKSGKCPFCGDVIPYKVETN